MTKSLMILGTTSNAGKSLITAALCRILKQDGYKVAPFKAQNMALNSYITEDGLEMGRAQVMQAEAAGIEPDVRMNPVLLKPTTDRKSQIIVNGKVWKDLSAQEYYHMKPEVFPKVIEAYGSLAKEYDVILCEGAGSPSEINLKKEDMVNMGFAKKMGIPAIIVGDIDRGGVFASLAGTMLLFDEEERELTKGFLINKFRGDQSILDPGLRQLEEITKVPVLGVVPYLDVDIEDEDSLSDQLTQKKGKGVIDIAVIRLPHISNFTDFNSLTLIPEVSLRYVNKGREFGNPDFVILPGTKSTMADLKWLREQGLDAKIKNHSLKGKPTFGVCGGYQMLGEVLEDPDGVESGGAMEGLRLLPIQTKFKNEKTTKQTVANIEEIEGWFSCISGETVKGYEIHMGETILQSGSFFTIGDSGKDGCVVNHVAGTYIHGFFDAGAIGEKIVKKLLEEKGLTMEDIHTFDYSEYKEEQYEKLANEVRKTIDMEKLYEILGL